MGNFSSCGETLKDPLEFWRGHSHVASGNSGNLSSFEGHLGIPVESLQRNRASWGSYRISTGESGLISFCGMELLFPLKLEKGYQASCRVQVGNLGFF